jgi:Ran-binding protein 9/10
LTEIRRAILKGDIDSALGLTREYYPSVLRDNENIYFKLRCRKFVEMIRQTTDFHDSPTLPAKKASQNGRSTHTHDDYNDVFNHQMELDEQLGAATFQNGTSRQQDNDWASVMDTAMDTSSDDIAGSTGLGIKTLEETIQYGQELKAEFSEDPRREVKKALEDTLALIAYADPRDGPLRELLDERGRAPVAEELNGAILGE